MVAGALVVVVLLVAAVVSLAVLTMLGARRRGGSWLLAFLEGLIFPVTWARWYVQDELPYTGVR